MVDEAEPKEVNQSLSESQPSRRDVSRRTVVVGLIGLAAAEVVAGGVTWPTFFRFQPSFPSTSTELAFTEYFQDNNRNWTVGSINNLTASIINGQYELQISSSSGETYFPHPDVGTLPDNFTLTISIEQTQGDQTNAYGLSFRFQQNGIGGVSCYALVIYTNGTYGVLKYDPNANNGYTILGRSNQPFSAIKTGLNRFNNLQVVVTGSVFSFIINGTRLPGPIFSDHTLTGGQLAVLIAGTNATFVVNKVTLTTP